MAKEEDYELDFAIPGQEAKDELDSADSAEQEKAADRSDISLFWLLQHYNKENAAAYKMQQSRKKEKKKNTKTVRTGKKEKKKTEEDALITPVSSQNMKKKAGAEEERRRKEDENFGRTVYVKRENRQDLGELPVCEAALECPGYGQTVPVDQLPFLIGRSSTGVDLCIADNKTVGRMHALISYHNGFYYIKDLNSLNHVFLNGRQIPSEKEIKLTDGTRITLGDEELIFHNSNK